MEISEKILTVTTLVLVTVVLQTDGGCSLESSQLPVGCRCPQPYFLQCVCPTVENKLTWLPGKEQIPNDVTDILFLNCQFRKIVNVPYKQLESLHIRNSGIDSIQEGAFKSLGSLNSLDLSGNELRNLTKGMFLGLTALKTLVVQSNNIELIASDAFDTLPQLRKLELSKNNGLQLPVNVFSKSINLQKVEIRQCGLNIIPSAVTKVRTLTELDLDLNSLQALKDNAFFPMKNLSTLGLDSCAIHTISDKAFDGLQQLTVLNLGHNHIKSIRPRHFKAFRDKLESLYIEDNELHTLSKDVLNWDQVKAVHLGHNPWICDCALRWISTELDSKNKKENVT